MRILIDIGHPGHVHLFKNFALIMNQKGHKILFTVRQKEFETELLQSFGFEFISFGKHFSSIPGKLFGLIKFDLKMLLTAIKFKPDIYLSHGSFYASHAALFQHKPHISLEDTGNMEQVRLYRPFTKAILSPDVLGANLGSKQILYRSYHELAYLHPKYFTPSSEIYSLLGIKSDEKYAILRFVSWKASHDVGNRGLSIEEKIQLVSKLNKRFKVFISSESILPPELSPYQIKLPPHMIHHAVNYAEIVISEGATLASEAGLLGVPTIYVNKIHATNNEDQEKYGTVYNFSNHSGILEKVEEILSTPHYKQVWQKKRGKIISDKIDLTALLVWFIEEYPESFNLLRDDPAFQEKFSDNT